MKRCWALFMPVLMLLLFGRLSFCETIQTLVKEIFQISSPTGYEEKMAAKIIELLPEEVSFEKDNLGSLYVFYGEEEPLLGFLTGMDEYGYFVSNITSEGYLNLDRAVRAPHPFFDSIHFGHHMLIHSELGVVKGVMALPSLHVLSRERRRDLNQLFTLNNIYLDIGAKSKQEVIDRGIKFLDPVTPVTEIITLSDQKISGYTLGRKVCAALLLDLALEALKHSSSKRRELVWLAQSLFPVQGSRSPSSLGSLRAGKILASSRLLFLDIYPCGRNPNDQIEIGMGPVLFSECEVKTRLIQDVEKCADLLSVSLQFATEAPSLLQSSLNNIYLCLLVKAAYTPSEIVSWEDVWAVQKLLKGLWKQED